MNTSPAHNCCLFCVSHEEIICKCKQGVGRPMKKVITALWGCPPWQTWNFRPDPYFFCNLYERDKTKPGYIDE